MTQSLIDISLIKDRQVAQAIDDTATVLTNAGIASNGAITSGVFNGTVGATTPAAGTFTTLTANSSLVAAAATITGVTSGTLAAAGKVGEFVYGEIKGTAATATVTITIATPGVVTWTSHGFSTVAPQPVVFTTSGSLPTGITSGTVYYTVPSSVTTNTFQIATTVANALAGTSVATSGSQSGTQTGTAGTALTTATSADVTGLSLTAGEWEVWAQVAWNAAATTTVTTLIGALNTASATLPGVALVNGKSQNSWLGTSQTATNGVPAILLPRTQLAVSSTQTVWLVAQSAFATSTNGAYGFIAARRVR